MAYYSKTFRGMSRSDRDDLRFWVSVADKLGLIVRAWTYRNYAQIGNETGSISYEVSEDLANRILRASK